MTLAEARQAAGYKSQQAFAFATGLAMRTVQRIEAGQLPSRKSAFAIARVLNKTVDQVYELCGADMAAATA